MSQTNNFEDIKEKEVVDDSEKDQICGEEGTMVEEVKDADKNKESPMPPAKEEVINVIYGADFCMVINISIVNFMIEKLRVDKKRFIR